MKKKYNKLIFITLIIILSNFFACSGNDNKPNPDEPKGSLVIVGGALKASNSSVFKKFIELGHGITKIKIAIIPTATSTPAQSGAYYKSTFVSYGVPANNIWIAPLAEQDDAKTQRIDEASAWEGNGFNKDIANKMKKYNAVWFTGGWQGRTRNLLMKLEGDEWKEGIVLKTIRDIYSKGGVIGGTSAGAAIMTDPMIDGGTSLGAVMQGYTHIDNAHNDKENSVYLTKGIGFWDGGMIGQHFIKRGRFGRLIVAMIGTGKKLGIGVDENTAIVIKGEEVEVFGETGVIIIDTDKAEISSTSPLIAKNIKMAYLEEKDKYYYKKKEFKFAKYKDQTIKGGEYSDIPPNINGNVFGKDALINQLINDLVDNTHSENYGIAFDGNGFLSGVDEGDGIKFRFYKKEDTNGYWGRKVFSGKAHYSVYNVYVDVSPINVQITDTEANNK